MQDLKQWLAELNSSKTEVRANAAENLCLAGIDSVDAAVELVSACADDESVQSWAVAALEELGPPRLDALEPLMELVTSSNHLVAYWAVTLLGRLGPDARTSQDVLAGALSNSPDRAVQERSAWAMGKIGPTTGDALTALKQATKSDNPKLVRLAQAALPSHEGLPG